MGCASSSPQERHIRLDLPDASAPFNSDNLLRWKAVKSTSDAREHAFSLFSGAELVGNDSQGHRLHLARCATPSGVWLGYVGHTMRYLRGAMFVTGVVADGSAVVVPFYEVLLGAVDGYSLSWETWEPNTPPPQGAVICGRTAEGQPLLAAIGAANDTPAVPAASRQVRRGQVAPRILGLASNGACLVHGSADSAVSLPHCDVLVVRPTRTNHVTGKLGSGSLAYPADQSVPVAMATDNPASTASIRASTLEGESARSSASDSDSEAGPSPSAPPPHPATLPPGSPVPLESYCSEGADPSTCERRAALLQLADSPQRQWGWHWRPRPLAPGTEADCASTGGLVWDCGAQNAQAHEGDGMWRGAGMDSSRHTPTEPWAKTWVASWPNCHFSYFNGGQVYRPSRPQTGDRQSRQLNVVRARSAAYSMDRQALYGTGPAARARRRHARVAGDNTAVAAAAFAVGAVSVEAADNMQWGFGEDDGWPFHHGHSHHHSGGSNWGAGTGGGDDRGWSGHGGSDSSSFWSGGGGSSSDWGSSSSDWGSSSSSSSDWGSSSSSSGFGSSSSDWGSSSSSGGGGFSSSSD